MALSCSIIFRLHLLHRHQISSLWSLCLTRFYGGSYWLMTDRQPSGKMSRLPISGTLFVYIALLPGVQADECIRQCLCLSLMLGFVAKHKLSGASKDVLFAQWSVFNRLSRSFLPQPLTIINSADNCAGLYSTGKPAFRNLFHRRIGLIYSPCPTVSESISVCLPPAFWISITRLLRTYVHKCQGLCEYRLCCRSGLLPQAMQQVYSSRGRWKQKCHYPDRA